MMNYNKIIFTGNIARFNPFKPGLSNQNQNIDWLRFIVEPHMAALGTMPLESFKWTGRGREGNDLYEILGLEYSLDNYLKMYLGEFNSELEDFLTSRFFESFVIGFEIPPFMINFFIKNQIPYIDIILGPIRFFPDLVPSLRSNVETISKSLHEEMLKDEEINAVASWRRAYFSKQRVPTSSTDTSVIIGQTSFDTSQIYNKKFVGIESFEEKIQNLALESNVIFKPHPYLLKSDLKRQMKLMKKYNIKVTNQNVYSLLCAETTKKVYSVSSSVSQEASYFGVSSDTFIEYPFPFSGSYTPELNKFFNIYHKITNTLFWGKLFDFGVDNPVRLPEGALSQSLGQSWGASIFTSDNKHSKNKLKFEAFFKLISGRR